MEGVRRVGLQRYAAGHHCRICRPVGLSPGDVKHVLSQAIGQLGCAYDTRNIIDLARYLFPTPPVPASWRREMIAFGSGDPTRAICSGLIAQSFEAVGYPVLPHVTYLPAPLVDCPDCVEQIMRVRHHSLYVPRDFDVSPYFESSSPASKQNSIFTFSIGSGKATSPESRLAVQTTSENPTALKYSGQKRPFDEC
jgi:hypothetical protein